MNRWGIAAVAVVGLLLAGCSNDTSSDPATTPEASTATPSNPTTSTAVLLSMVDACPKVQDAIDANFDGETFPPPSAFRQFAADILALAEQTDPQGQNILETLAGTVNQVADDIENAGSDLNDQFEAVDQYITEMERVSQVCIEQGAAPLA